jgi:hypothetical protein
MGACGCGHLLLASSFISQKMSWRHDGWWEKERTVLVPAEEFGWRRGPRTLYVAIASHEHLTRACLSSNFEVLGFYHCLMCMVLNNHTHHNISHAHHPLSALHFFALHSLPCIFASTKILIGYLIGYLSLLSLDKSPHFSPFSTHQPCNQTHEENCIFILFRQTRLL